MGSSPSVKKNQATEGGEEEMNPAAVKARNKEIERALAKEKIEQATLIKILLLGGSESGKTTVFKQMRILHMNGFSKSDLINYRYVIHLNTVDALSQLLDACDQFRLVHENDTQCHVKDFLKYKQSTKTEGMDYDLSPEIADKMSRIWRSSAVQSAYDRRFDFELLDSAKYFLDQITRLGENSYVPTQQDILQCRFRTTGINEITFEFKELSFRMVDVGGQKSERRKWIHCFDNTNLILFILSASDYDAKEPEEVDKNRLLHNIDIYKTIVQSEHFRKSSVVLFLNKRDIFADKLANSPLSACFSDYAGGDNAEDGLKFITSKVQSATPEGKRFFAFHTTATDTKNIELVFGTAVAHIVEQNLKSTGLQI